MLIRIRKMMTNQKGFTLVELMVVIAILGILAAIAIPRMSAATDSSKVAKIQADLRTMGGAVAMFQARTGALPAALGDMVGANRELAAVPTPPSGAGAYTLTAGTGVITCVFNGTTYSSQ